MTFRIPFEARGEFIRGQMDYWRQVRESGCSDLERILVTTGLMPYDCESEDLRYPHPVLVKRYANWGYNMCHGTNFQLHYLKKFNVTMNCQATYYITLAACDPAASPSLVTFQVGVAEGSRGSASCSLNLSCFIARPQGGAANLT